MQRLADQLTAQFYQWEQRGRGWFAFPEPVQLEPAFVPFFFHNLPIHNDAIIDDGKRHTLASMFLAEARKLFGAKHGQPMATTEDSHIEAYPYEEDITRVCLSVSFPKGQKISAIETEQLLLMMANCKHPVSFEIIALAERIAVQYTCSEAELPFLTSQLKAHFPTSVLIKKNDALLPIIDNELHIIDFGLREEFMRPVAMSTGFDPDPLISVFGILEHLQKGEGGAIQILFVGCQNPWAESILRAVSDDGGGAFFVDAPDMLPLAKQKVSAPLFAVSIRSIGMSELKSRAEDIAWNIGNALVHLSRTSGNQLMPLINDEFSHGDHVEGLLYRQTHRLGMLLNSRELASLAHYPSASVASLKLERDTKKTKAVSAYAMGHTFALGQNEHQGQTIPATQNNDQRLKHTHIIGATGTGKSTMLLSMIAQDIAANNGFAVLDPHGDLIEKILAYIPPERIRDVLLIDPADAEHPVGFNILSAHSEIEKDILSSDLVAAFRRLSTSWGDQMNSVFANAILAFLESSKGGTLADLRRFLIDKNYRDTFLKTVSDPSIVYYWHREYPLLKSGSIGSILTRLDAFLRPKLIRNMVCQQKSIDFDRLMNERKIILLKLSQGLIGAENSYLLGTFIVSKLQQSAMARQATTEANRQPFYLYIDEFQHFITPSMNSILSGTRKYHLGLILAHQSMQQIADAEISSAIIANAGTRLCFRLGEADAKKLEAGFSYFEAKDLQNLAVGEVIARIERPEHDFSLTTTPADVPIQPTHIQEQVISYSREHYSMARKEVEAMVAETMQLPASKEVPKVIKPTIYIQEELVPRQEQSREKMQVPVTNQQHAPALERKSAPSQHTYLKTLIKRMAEDRGFVATTEEMTPDGKGKVDVGLTRNGKRIACEISVTTTDIWEIHNAEKCLAAGYDTVIICSTDKRHLEKIQKLIQLHPASSVHSKVLTLNPENLFLFLDQQIAQEASSEERINGYRVSVEYKAVPEAAAKQKREHIIKTLLDSIRKNKKQ